MPEEFSITDFMMHKVSPTEDTPELAPIFKSAEETPVKKPVERPVSRPKITGPKPVQKVKAVTKKAVTKEPVKKIAKEIVKKTVKEIKVETPKETVTEVTTEVPEVTVVKGEFKEIPVAAEKPEKENGFNRQNYLENVNNSLNGDSTSHVVESTGEKSYDSYDYIVKPTVSLGIVLVLIVIFAWLYKKLGGINPNSLLSGKFKGLDTNKFTVLASSSLGQGKIIHLVEINGKQLVVGSTNNNINLLTEISPEDLEKLKAKAGGRMKPEVKVKATPEELDELEHTEPESYSAKYSNVYKDYIE